MIRIIYCDCNCEYASDFKILDFCKNIINKTKNKLKQDYEFKVNREDIIYILASCIQNKIITNTDIQFYVECENKLLEIRVDKEGSILDEFSTEGFKISEAIFEGVQ